MIYLGRKADCTIAPLKLSLRLVEPIGTSGYTISYYGFNSGYIRPTFALIAEG